MKTAAGAGNARHSRYLLRHETGRVVSTVTVWSGIAELAGDAARSVVNIPAIVA